MSDGLHATVGAILTIALLTLALAHTAERTMSEINYNRLYNEQPQ